MSEQKTPYTVPADGPHVEPVVVTNVLAIARFLLGDLTEGQLARKLDLDRLETRARVAEFLNTAIANAQVPIERIAVLEQRLATALTQAGRLDLERGELAHQAATYEANNRELTVTINRCLFQIEELREDLAAERAHVLSLLRVADYARRLAENITLSIGDPEQPGSLSAAELYALANEALGGETAGPEVAGATHRSNVRPGREALGEM